MYRNGSKGSPADGMFAFIGAITVLVGLIRFILHVYAFLKSFRFQEKIKSAKNPNWLSIDLNAPELWKSSVPINEFCVYTKDYIMQMVQNRNRNQEKDKKVIRKMRTLLEEIFGITVDERQLPESTCIISIPKINFRSGEIFGEFVPIHGGPSDSYFEYQMIGDDRIQVTYYIVGGVSYVAGLCIYIENPYQWTVHYRRNIIRRLMKEPEYWSNYNLKQETMDIVSRKAYNKLMVITKNRYGEIKNWNFNGQENRFEPIGPFKDIKWELVIEENPNFQSKFLKVKICKSQNDIVMIAERSQYKMHAVWNKNTKQIEYFKCDSCNEANDAPPPSYQSALKEIVSKADLV